MKRETINYIHSLLTAHKDKLWEEVQEIGREMEHTDNRGECWDRGKVKRDEWDAASAALKDFENHDW